MCEIIQTLDRMQHRDADAAAVGVRVAAGEILAALERLEVEVGREGVSAEHAIWVTTLAEGLLTNMGRPRLLEQVEGRRRRLTAHLGDWSRARFGAEHQEFNGLLHHGQFQQALVVAARTRAALEDARYPGEEYDRAMAAFNIGRASQRAGRAADALVYLAEAEAGFAELARGGNANAEGMRATSIGERGDALMALGRLDEAAEAMAEGARLDEACGDRRSAAVGRFQLGSIRMDQGRLDEARAAFDRGRSDFEALGEPGGVAAAWHQLGLVHMLGRNWERSEDALRQSLAIKTRLGNRPGEASSLSALGGLYNDIGRLEEAVGLCRRAAELHGALANHTKEAVSQSNLAIALWRLNRLDEARAAVEQAIALQAPFGAAAHPWKSRDILHDIESDAGRPQQATRARAEARALYAAYRRDRGAPDDDTARSYAEITAKIAEGADANAVELPPPDEVPDWMRPTHIALLAALHGDPVPAADPRLNYRLSVELELLLEALAAGRS